MHEEAIIGPDFRRPIDTTVIAGGWSPTERNTAQAFAQNTEAAAI